MNAKVSPLTVRDFLECTIAQGSGLTGYDVIHVFQNGSGYAEFGNRHLGEQRRKVAFRLSDEEMRSLIAALNSDRVSTLASHYSAAIHDGAQGFIDLRTVGGSYRTELNNYFDPVEHTYEWCNDVIWRPMEASTLPKPEGWFQSSPAAR